MAYAVKMFKNTEYGVKRGMYRGYDEVYALDDENLLDLVHELEDVGYDHFEVEIIDDELMLA